jgi:hypothetical protein
VCSNLDWFCPIECRISIFGKSPQMGGRWVFRKTLYRFAKTTEITYFLLNADGRIGFWDHNGGGANFGAGRLADWIVEDWLES